MKSLVDLCVDNVVAHVDALWAKDFLLSYHGQAHWLFTLGPFDTLPASLAHKIWLNLKNRKLLRKHHVYLLLHPGLRELDASREQVDLGLALHLASVRCPGLRRLDLSWAPKFPKATFLQLYPSFPGLTTLDLSGIKVVDDEVASLLGVYGGSLRSLDLSSTGVSGRGLRTLALKEDLKGKPDPRYGQCVGLRFLGLQVTHVSPEEVASILGSLLDLVDLSYEESLESVSYYLRKNRDVKRLRLKFLSSKSPSLPKEDLSLVLAKCNDLVKLHLSCFEELDWSCFLPLAEKSEIDLRELQVSNEFGVSNASMVTTLTPLLLSHGKSLVNLAFSEVADVNVEVILNCCPNLVSLSLQFNEAYSRNDQNHQEDEGFGEKGLERLKFLKILCRETSGDVLTSNSPSRREILRLLSSPRLESVEISHCERLDDETFGQAFIQHDFAQLEHLSLIACNNIRFSDLSEFLSQSRKLKHVQFRMCQDIYLSDIQKYKADLARRRLVKKIQVDWT